MGQDDREPASVQAWFHETATRYVEAQALYHLNKVGVFTALLDAGPLSAAELAARLGLVPSLLEVLLEYVAGVDDLIVRGAGGRYALTDFGARVLERYGRRDPD